MDNFVQSFTAFIENFIKMIRDLVSFFRKYNDKGILSGLEDELTEVTED